MVCLLTTKLLGWRIIFLVFSSVSDNDFWWRIFYMMQHEKYVCIVFVHVEICNDYWCLLNFNLALNYWWLFFFLDYSYLWHLLNFSRVFLERFLELLVIVQYFFLNFLNFMTQFHRFSSAYYSKQRRMRGFPRPLVAKLPRECQGVPPMHPKFLAVGLLPWDILLREPNEP